MIVTEANYEDVLKLRQQVMYPDKDIDFVKLPDDDKGIHLGIFEEGVLISAVSIFMHENRNVQFRKLATRKDMQGKGYGIMLLKWLIDYANDVKLNRIWCNAREESLGFYQKAGFKETGERFNRNGHNYIVMEMLPQIQK